MTIHELILVSHDRPAANGRPAMTARQVMRGVLTYIGYASSPALIRDDLNLSDEEFLAKRREVQAAGVPDVVPDVHCVYSDEGDPNKGNYMSSSLIIAPGVYEIGEENELVEKTPPTIYPGYLAILHTYRRALVDFEIEAIRANGIEVHKREEWEYGRFVQGFLV